MILDLNELQVPEIQHDSAIDQCSSPRLPLSCVLLPFIDEQRLPSDMGSMFREVQNGSSLV